MNDDLQFRPMSKGLGFHQAKDVRSTINKTTLPPKKPVLIQQAALLSNRNKMMSHPTTAPTMLKRANTLTNISLATESQLDSKAILPSISKSQTTLGLRFFSWLIDITTLCLLMIVSSALIFQLNNFSWDEPLQFFQMDFFWNLYLPLGVGFYLFYFMLFERVTGQTLGKLLLGLKVVKINSDQPPTLWQCFMRNVLNLVSLSTLGLLTIYDVVNWSLGLKVIKANSK